MILCSFNATLALTPEGQICVGLSSMIGSKVTAGSHLKEYKKVITVLIYKGINALTCNIAKKKVWAVKNMY